MFLRFLGRIFLYFVIIPTVAPFLKGVLHSMLLRYVRDGLANMTPEQRAPYDRYLRSMSRPASPRR